MATGEEIVSIGEIDSVDLVDSDNPYKKPAIKSSIDTLIRCFLLWFLH